MPDTYFTFVEGVPDTFDYKVYCCDDGGLLSYFHDVPLRFNSSNNNLFNMVVEIPRWTNAKLEISKSERFNPIIQDTKNGKLRYVANVFPNHGYPWNYGAFPQTWEKPDYIDKDTQCGGDNDPLDCIELGSRVYKTGEIIQVKVLGVLGMIDAGETDWKVITISSDDPLFGVLNDIQDVEKHCPNLLGSTLHWLTVYKIPDGKPKNVFAFNGEFRGKDFALKIVDECHHFWTGLMKDGIEDVRKLALYNVSQMESHFKMNRYSANTLLDTMRHHSQSKQRYSQDFVGKGDVIPALPDHLGGYNFLNSRK